ncbi:MAG: hypothetical protein UX09_C0006G0018 [Candidatus Uhrbacteria bacterium GW2011_GWE2_45_35]|uniref:Host attachment protein n=2 Tax=Candidatus Uhriibacteriota TaxID=1752732 RepID=A0A0G1JIV5_9BACT|nr:MAG: hypothetical protein UW63_C0014G0008 [Candidatus Uhrbacteria bacterium GW2011_GWF2_44_350]KKU09022.1 MAG: hypothetical protein UX09_C0006G0018 [Candidatus Uhrbacteria bacterium GW2011_GWE2_45_35]HBR81144.1 hypothetical protein [Candidatus Uhrbacteria bacterium]HCU31620.1 hypothetical protein [Candidatus Uhrbacteria bacterium]
MIRVDQHKYQEFSRLFFLLIKLVYNKTIMQIPSSLQPFPKKTLIVVTNSYKAKLFEADDRLLKTAGEVDVTSDLIQDSGERETINLGGGGFASNDEIGAKKEHITKDHFYNALNKELMHRLQNNEFAALVFTVPGDLKNELMESLHGQLLKKTALFIPMNLINEEPLEIIAAIQETPDE